MPTRRAALLDLIFTNKEGLTGDVKVKGSLRCTDHDMDQDPERREQGKKQDHKPGLQENRI